jgi:GAF domain-containing protein
LAAGSPYIVHDVSIEAVCAECSEHAVQRGCRSVIALPLVANSRDQHNAVLCIYAGSSSAFEASEVDLLRELADNLGYGLRALRAHSERERLLASLSESVKEANCLYEITSLAQTSNTLDELFAGAAARLPHGYRFPEVTRARVTFEGRTYGTRFEETSWMQTAEIRIAGEPCGSVAVALLEEQTQADGGPHLGDRCPAQTRRAGHARQ